MLKHTPAINFWKVYIKHYQIVSVLPNKMEAVNSRGSLINYIATFA